MTSEGTKATTIVSQRGNNTDHAIIETETPTSSKLIIVCFNIVFNTFIETSHKA